MSLSITRNYSDNTILTEQQLDDAFDDIEIKFNTTKIAGSEIQDGAIATDNIAASAVTAAKIDSNAVTTVKIQDDAVTNAKVADNAIDTIQIVNGAVTKPKQAAVGQIISSSSGNYNPGFLGSYTTPTNLSVSITTTGRPVMILLMPDGSNMSYIRFTASTGFNASYDWRFRRDGSTICEGQVLTGFTTSPTQFNMAPGVHIFLDTPAAGTYTYDFQVNNTTIVVNYVKLVVYEL